VERKISSDRRCSWTWRNDRSWVCQRSENKRTISRIFCSSHQRMCSERIDDRGSRYIWKCYPIPCTTRYDRWTVRSWTWYLWICDQRIIREI
jgi:GABAtrnsam: 4-aminobutyrate transaminase